MDKQIFQITGCISGIKTMSNWWRISFDTQEGMSGDAISRLTDLKDKISWLTVSHRIIEPDDIIDLPAIKSIEPDEKSPSQRLRAALFVMWKQHPEGFATDEDHYKYYLNKFIEHVKSKLDK
jgi:hypothetical protein